VLVPAATYRITGSIRLSDGVRLCGVGPATIIKYEAEDAIVLEPPGAGDFAELAEDVSGRRVQLKDAADVQVGDWIRLHNGLPYDYKKPNEPDDPATQKEYFRVVAVGGAGATLTLDRTPCFTYSINRGASAARWGYIGDAAVSDLTIQPAPGKQAVWANHALNCVAERLVVDGGGQGKGIQFCQSLYCTIDRCVVRNTIGSTAIFLTYWSHGCRVTNNHIEHHDINTTGDGLLLLYFGCRAVATTLSQATPSATPRRPAAISMAFASTPSRTRIPSPTTPCLGRRTG